MNNNEQMNNDGGNIGDGDGDAATSNQRMNTFNILDCRLNIAIKDKNYDRVQHLLGLIGRMTTVTYANQHNSNQRSRSLPLSPWLFPRAPVNINHKDTLGRTPLHNACLTYCPEDILRLLLKHEQINVNATDDAGVTPLHCAVTQNNLNIVTVLCEFGANVNAKDNKGNMPVHYLNWFDYNPNILDVLKTGNADFNAKNHNGLSLLHLACEKVLPDLLKFLLIQSCDISARDSQGKTILHYITDMNQFQLFNILNMESERLYDENDQLVYALNNEFINAIDDLGNTALHFVKSNKIAEWLLEHRANVNLRNHEGRTPLYTLFVYTLQCRRLDNMVINTFLRFDSHMDYNDIEVQSICNFVHNNVPLNKTIIFFLIKCNQDELQTISAMPEYHQYAPFLREFHAMQYRRVKPFGFKLFDVHFNFELYHRDTDIDWYDLDQNIIERFKTSFPIYGADIGRQFEILCGR